MKFTYVFSLLAALSTSVHGADMGGDLFMAAPPAGLCDCKTEYKALQTCLVFVGLSPDQIKTILSHSYYCTMRVFGPIMEKVAPPPSEPCPFTCDVVDDCTDVTMRTVGALVTNEISPCSFEATALGDCVVNELVEKLNPAFPPCQCHDDVDFPYNDDDNFPTPPPTSDSLTTSPPTRDSLTASSKSLGLVASVLKKNLRA